jgi:hypothetical protein
MRLSDLFAVPRYGGVVHREFLPRCSLVTKGQLPSQAVGVPVVRVVGDGLAQQPPAAVAIDGFQKR